MNSPPRLLDSAKNAHARSLLRAGAEDSPSPAALRAAALSLGIGASLTAASTATASVVGATAAAAAPSLPLIAAKWIAIGTLGGVSLAGGASVVSGWTSPAPAPSVTQPSAHVVVPSSRTESALSRASEPAPLPVAAPELVPQPEPRREPSVNSSPSAATVRVAPAPLRPDLASEISLIDGARRALTSGDARATLRKLDEYGARPRTGTLDRESQLLRVDALSMVGERASAAALAEQYVSMFPRDPHAARLRELIGDRSAPERTR